MKKIESLNQYDELFRAYEAIDIFDEKGKVLVKIKGGHGWPVTPRQVRGSTTRVYDAIKGAPYAIPYAAGKWLVEKGLAYVGE